MAARLPLAVPPTETPTEVLSGVLPSLLLLGLLVGGGVLACRGLARLRPVSRAGRGWKVAAALVLPPALALGAVLLSPPLAAWLSGAQIPAPDPQGRAGTLLSAAFLLTFTLVFALAQVLVYALLAGAVVLALMAAVELVAWRDADRPHDA